MENNTLRLKTIVSELLKIDIKDINDDLEAKSTETWDSFNTLNIIMEIENEFNIEVDLEELINLSTFKHLKDLLEKNNIKCS
jgi:acyl carrier protein